MSCCCCLPCNHCSNGHGLLKFFLAFLVIGYVLRTAGSSFMWNYADPLTSLELLNYYLTLAMSSGRFAYYVIQRNDTTNDSIFHMSGGMQGVYSKMLGVVRILFLVSWVQELTLTLSCGQVATHLPTALPCVCVGTVNGSCAELNGHPSSFSCI